jgi:hypothetical protein
MTFSCFLCICWSLLNNEYLTGTGMSVIYQSCRYYR